MDFITVPPLSASSLAGKDMQQAIDTDTQAFFQLLTALVKSTLRQDAAHQLARYLGAEDLLILLSDTETGALLPAPGFMQTLPAGQRWQNVLASCHQNTPVHTTLPFPDEITLKAAVVFINENKTVLVLLGGKPQLAKILFLVTLLPLLEAVFQREQAGQIAEAESKIARNTAAQTQNLLTILDEARQETQNELSERIRVEGALREQVRLATLQMEVSTALTTGGTVREVLGQCAKVLVRHLDAAFARVWTLNEIEQVLELQASAGMYTHLDGEHARVPVGSWKVGLIGKNHKPHLTNTVIGDQLIPDQEWAKREGMVAFAGYPLLVEDHLSGVMAIFARHKLTEATLEAMATVANAIALGIEHQRAVEALRQKQQTLEIALIASKTGTFRWDPFARILLEFDANFKKLFGFAPDKPIRDTKDFRNRIHPDDVAAILPTIERCLQSGNFEMEFRVFHSNGSVHWLYSQANIEYNEQEKPLYLVGACTDITQRKQAEEELRENAERLRFMAESMPQKIFTTKPNGDIDYVNPQWEKFTGLSFAEMEGWGWLQFVHPSDVEGNIKSWLHSTETGEPFAIEHRFRRADGVYRWHLSRAIPMHDANGHITMWIGSSTDITEQKELTQQKETFMNITTHELKTPLTSMKGYMQLAERLIRRLLQAQQMEPIEQKNTLEQILSMLNRSQQQLGVQNRLVTDLLDASRMQEGPLELHLEPCDLKNLVRKTVENYQIAYPYRHIALDLPEQAIPMVRVDSGRIEQVLSNFLTNALKYSTKDKMVQVGMTCKPSTAQVWVADQGPGLSYEAQQHIWERFYRVPGITVQNNTGASLGLGLSICQGIISNHHGHVGVESTPGQGSRFWFMLPLLPQAT